MAFRLPIACLSLLLVRLNHSAVITTALAATVDGVFSFRRSIFDVQVMLLCGIIGGESLRARHRKVSGSRDGAPVLFDISFVAPQRICRRAADTGAMIMLYPNPMTGIPTAAEGLQIVEAADMPNRALTIAAIQQTGYDGPIGVEIIGHDHWQRDPQTAALISLDTTMTDVQ